jgi:endonuclease/exonuclease/phosphatase family metal-dependent hydrolase
MEGPRYPGRPSSGGLRVATINVWGRRGAWAERRRVLADGFLALRPDLISFVESIKTDDYDLVTDILGPEYYVAHQKDREAYRADNPKDEQDLYGMEDGQGVSIASRWPLGEVREVDLDVTSRTGDFAHTTLLAEVLAPEPIGPLLFLCHNCSWQLTFEHERELQAVAVARFVEKLLRRRSMHVVLAGDFDAAPDAASIRFWTGRQSLGGMSVCYRDAWETVHPGESGHTFTARNPLMTAENDDWALELGRRIDYIFVRCGEHGPTLDVTASERIFDEPVDGVWASDHFGVIADLVTRTSNGRPAW